jgi:hypothetical protein
MPKIHEESNLEFFFYSSDMDEPPHIHAEYKEGGVIKVWLLTLKPAWVRAGLPRHKQTEALKIIEEQQEKFLKR